ncbi:MAG: transcriptional regulator [Methylomonas sp.]|jgi:hypothetical protein
MYTIIETALFTHDSKSIWNEDERGEFCAWLVERPETGTVVPGSGGCRKIRWTREGTGKRGGVRVIYYNRLAYGEIYLLVIYAKNVQGNIPGHLLKTIKETIGNV